jgi:tRNA-2-methylthio-N6-dimethylallyladenosine synthase
MNVNDSEIVRSIFSSNPQLFNPSETKTPEEANIVFLNTCAIRDSAEQRIFARIRQLKALKSIKVLGLLGCMAERLREKMFSEGVNIIAGPDTYRDLPKLIETSLSDDTKRNQMNVQLSVE